MAHGTGTNPRDNSRLHSIPCMDKITFPRTTVVPHGPLRKECFEICEESNEKLGFPSFDLIEIRTIFTTTSF